MNYSLPNNTQLRRKNCDKGIINGRRALFMAGLLNIAVPFGTASLAQLAASSSALSSFTPYGWNNARDECSYAIYRPCPGDAFVSGGNEFNIVTCGFQGIGAQPILAGKGRPRIFSDTLEIMTDIALNRQGAEHAVQCAAESIQGALEMLEASLGEGSRVAAAMTTGLASLEGARRILSGMEGLCGVVAERLELQHHTDTQRAPSPAADDQRYESANCHAFPGVALAHSTLSPEAVAAISNLGAEIASVICERLRTLFNSDIKQSSQLFDAFLRATSVIRSHFHVDGARENFNTTIAALLNPGKADSSARGIVFEFLRIAQIMSSGRHLDGVNVFFRDVCFLGWWFDAENKYFHPKYFTEDLEADAIDGDTLIEVKTTWLGGHVGELIKVLLEHSNDAGKFRKYHFDRSDFGRNGVKEAHYAAKLVSQFLKYRKLITTGKAKKIELHITSRMPIPDEILRALYGLFPQGALEVIWYNSILSTKGVLLLNVDATATFEPSPEMQESHDDKPAITLRSPDRTTFAERPQGSDFAAIEAEAALSQELTGGNVDYNEPGPIQSSGVEPTPRGAFDETLSLDSAATSRHRDLEARITRLSYRNFSNRAKDNRTSVERFIQWVIKEHGEELSGLSKKALSKRLKALFKTWQRLEATAMDH
jgi:hypothetical protein